VPANFLEQLVAEWYEYQGYFVRRNVLVGRRPNGGYECELDVVAFHPITQHLVHIEPSMDADSWTVRDERYHKKFEAGRRYIPELFSGQALPKEIEQIALLVFASTSAHPTIGGGKVMLVSELLGRIAGGLRDKHLASAAIPEHLTILRTMQFVSEYRSVVIAAWQQTPQHEAALQTGAPATQSLDLPMMYYPAPTRADQHGFLLRLCFGAAPSNDPRAALAGHDEDALIRLYFGDGADWLGLCISRAYRDFSRTLHGIADMPHIRQLASEAVARRFTDPRDDSTITDQDAFDRWHRSACRGLCSLYAEHGYTRFHVGQAQKWLNMTLKYVYTMGDQRLPGYGHLYPFAHSPLDNIMLRQLNMIGDPPELSAPWSRISDYDEYLRFQRWMRACFTGSAPLAVEFHLWQQDVT
jgi:hypothetical protein